MPYSKPQRWKNPRNKLFPHQVGFTGPPHDWDAAPTDFLSIAPEGVGAHGRMLHAPIYSHQLSERRDNFDLLEEFVHCMANNGADVAAQVGTNWVHASGMNAVQIRSHCDYLSNKYDTPFHMAGMTLVDAARALGADKITLNSVYYWPEWRDGLADFLRSADIDVAYAGNFVDLRLFANQQLVNDQNWIFPEEVAVESVVRAAEAAPDVDLVVVNGMPNFRGTDGIPRRTLRYVDQMEAAIGKPVIASDTALYWAIFQTLGVSPTDAPGALLGSLL